ncbi:cell wall protein [Microbacterium sp. RD1]|uniref:cell wall protein n=1 Tax=Microbacterium sp. RD1 TaxID=3457313 RepID=UPI003FA5568A
MSKLLPRAVAVLALAAGALFAVPVAAAAYPADDAASVSDAVVQPGGTVTLTVADGTFGANEPATITVTGENGARVTFGMVRAAVSTATYRDATTNAAGGLDPVRLTFPSDARGAYTIAVFTSSSPGDTVTVTVNGLSATGADLGPYLGLMVGGGALALAGGAVAVATTVVRRRRDAL